MRLNPRVRTLGFAGATLTLAFTLACINRPMKRAIPDPNPSIDQLPPQTNERDVDLLFIIDNSGSMDGEQINLQAQFPALMQELRNMIGGLPNVHIGVTSTDLGVGAFQIQLCDPGGDAGDLQILPSCEANIQTGAKYLIDVEPTGCNIDKEFVPDGPNAGQLVQCTNHDCQQTNCDDADDSTTTIVVEANGCPRCVNYNVGTLEDNFSCIARLGTTGCGFEQQLESMVAALDDNANNVGFVRPGAFLAVVFITDEDDCSASNPQLFDTTQSDINSTLGPITSFRCFEFGISCDINTRTHQGLRQDCVPREDPAAMLHPISRYTGFLDQIKAPEQLIIAAITGPINNNSVTVGLDNQQRPDVQFSCSTAAGGAVPAIRLRALVEAFNTDDDMAFAFSSICAGDYSPALAGIGKKISNVLNTCMPIPLLGCSDPGLEQGQPGVTSCNPPSGTPDPNNPATLEGRCLASCNVTDIFNRGTPEETRQVVPPCLEICPGGSCPGNIDYQQAYQNGHPNRRDPALPVAACWHINYEPRCTTGNFAELIVARQADPPPRSFADVSCRGTPESEQLCDDGVDNDGDCLLDCLDPDCSGAATCQVP